MVYYAVGLVHVSTPMHTVVMDDGLITTAVFAGPAVVLGVGYFVVRLRTTQRDRDGAMAQVRAERQRADEAEQSAAEWKQHATVATGRLVAFQEHIDEIVQGTRHKAPRRVWLVKGSGAVAGVVAGAWAAMRTALTPTAVSNAAVGAGSAVTGGALQAVGISGVIVAVVATGVMTAPTTATVPPQHRPPVALGAPPPAKQRKTPSLPVRSLPAKAPPLAAETPSRTPTPITQATPMPTPTRSKPSSTTAADTPPDTPAPSSAPTPVAASVDAAPTPSAAAGVGTPTARVGTPAEAVLPTPSAATPAASNAQPARHGTCPRLDPVLSICV